MPHTFPKAHFRLHSANVSCCDADVLAAILAMVGTNTVFGGSCGSASATGTERLPKEERVSDMLQLHQRAVAEAVEVERIVVGEPVR